MVVCEYTLDTNHECVHTHSNNSFAYRNVVIEAKKKNFHKKNAYFVFFILSKKKQNVHIEHKYSLIFLWKLFFLLKK